MSARDEDYGVGPLDMAAVGADAEALDAFIADDDAVSWDFLDPALALLASLREDVGADLTSGAAATVELTSLDLNVPRRRRHMGKRAVVAAAVAATVLSASGVAAAGIATGPTGPLGSIHRLLVGGPSASDRAAKQVRLFLRLAQGDLSGGRLPAAGEALDHATTWLGRVDASDSSDLSAQLAALKSQYAAALAAADARSAGSAAGKSGDDHGKSGSAGTSSHGGANKSTGKSDSNSSNKSAGKSDNRSDDQGGTNRHQGSPDGGHVQSSGGGASDSQDGSGATADITTQAKANTSDDAVSRSGKSLGPNS